MFSARVSDQVRRRLLIIRYLLRFPLLLVGLSVLYTAISYLIPLISSSTEYDVDASALVSPSSDQDLAKLEADTILSSLASNVLPAHTGLTPEKSIPTSDAERVIDDFTRADVVRMKRWDQIGRAVAVFGGISYLGMEIARATVHGQWLGVVFPVRPAYSSYQIGVGQHDYR